MYCTGIGTKFFYTNTFTKGSKDSILVIYTYGCPIASMQINTIAWKKALD